MFIVTNACTNNPCLNGATCNPTGTGTTYTCTCVSGYSGANCQLCKRILKNENKFKSLNFSFKDNACFNNPCLNGATCQTTGSSVGNYLCICPTFYSGTNCQICNFLKSQIIYSKNNLYKIYIRFKCMFY